MPRGKGIYDDEKAVEHNEPTSGDIADESTPDVAETDEEPTD
jgi:hypothetical protein